MVEPFRERRNTRACTHGDRVENISRGRKPRFDTRIPRMNRARHDAADAWNQIRLFADRHDACGGADHVDDIAEPYSGADGIPVRIDSANRDWDTRRQSQSFGPYRAQPARYLIRRCIAPAYPRWDSSQQRVNRFEKFILRETAERSVPHPFMTHGANAARNCRRFRDTAQCGRHHVAMLERRDEPAALVWMIPQPVEHLRKAPLGGIDAAAPINRFEICAVGLRSNLRRFLPGPVVAPKIVIVERSKTVANWHHARPGRIERNGGNLVAVNVRRVARPLHGEHQRVHMIVVLLRGVIGILFLAEERVFGNARPKPAFQMIEDRDAYGSSAEIDASDDAHQAGMICEAEELSNF